MRANIQPARYSATASRRRMLTARRTESANTSRNRLAVRAATVGPESLEVMGIIRPHGAPRGSILQRDNDGSGADLGTADQFQNDLPPLNSTTSRETIWGCDAAPNLGPDCVFS
jgi:hypothetical protein